MAYNLRRRVGIVYFLACVLCAPCFARGQEAHPQSQGLTASPDALYISIQDAVVVPACDLTIAKAADGMRFDVIREFPQGGFQLGFFYEGLPIRASVTIYKAPDDTKGPSVVLDASGEAILDEDRTNPYAVCKLSLPSQSFEDEFRTMVKNVEQVTGMQFVNQKGKPARKLAWPSDLKNSPVAYVAFFKRVAKDGEPIDPSLDEVQESRLYFFKGHFVKIHVSGPNCQEFLGAPVVMASAVWGRELPSVNNSIGMELIEIPAGRFTMGSPKSEMDHQDAEAQVAVTLTKPFELSKTEVTQGQWKSVMDTEPWNGQGNVQADKDCPATFVSYFDAVEFCEKLTELERESGKLKANEEYRLPTEAEWEYACRAGTTTTFSFGDDESKLGKYAWFDGNALNVDEQYAHKVGLKKPNPWGLHDMHGNVWEWCSDWADSTLQGGSDPVGPEEGSYRVLRGGGWGDDPGGCRSAHRHSGVPSLRGFLGFRVARSQSAQ